MDESWDADNFEPKLPTTLTTVSKWDGEDEEETVKESWEDEEEEKKDEEKKDQPPSATLKPKKKIADKIAEKERLAREKSEKLTEKGEDLTPEQRAAEKLRQQKLQEESDLRLAMETFGLSAADVGAGKIDAFHPTTKEEFTEFADLICKKISYYKTKEEFPAFVEDLFRNIVVQMSSSDIKRIKLSVDNLYIEKQKVEKNDKAKKPTKGKGKAKLKVENDSATLESYDNFNDDYDDFM